MTVNKKQKLLFIQHASEFGGSAMSLLYTLQGIRINAKEDFSITIALAKWNLDLANFYINNGFKVVDAHWIDTYEHTQAVYYNLLNPLGLIQEFIQRVKIIRARRRTRELILLIKPDLVHLNSVVLVGSAIELNSMKIPFVWHVREHAVEGLFKIRKNYLITLLKELPNKVIFICEADKQSWGKPLNSIVVYNFIDFDKFKPELPEGYPKRTMKKDQQFNILFLGGVNKIKGTIVILKAIAELKRKETNKNINLIFPGGKYELPNYFLYRIVSVILPIFGRGTYSQQVERLIVDLDLEENLTRLPFTKDVWLLYEKSDILVFPSIRPHFARPIIEAGAMYLPALGSNIGGVRELITDGVNGFLCKPGDHLDLATKMHLLLLESELSIRLGANGYINSFNKFNQKVNINRIIEVYKSLIFNNVY
jgi:glycosyltransferase involved in cell wall biosynthesis